MTEREHPRAKLERVSAERQRIVDNALATLPPPAAGLTRVMWFGESDIAKPVDVPEAVAAQIAAISERAGLNKGPICGVPTGAHFKAMGEMHRLMRPYIEAQYPTSRHVRSQQHEREAELIRTAPWWVRLLARVLR